MSTLTPEQSTTEYAQLWPCGEQAPDNAKGDWEAGAWRGGLTLDAIPSAIGEALNSQDMVLIDQVVIRVGIDTVGPDERYWMEVLEYRRPDYPSGPYWFSQYFPAFMMAVRSERILESDCPITLCADRGGLFWSTDPAIGRTMSRSSLEDPTVH